MAEQEGQRGGKRNDDAGRGKNRGSNSGVHSLEFHISTVDVGPVRTGGWRRPSDRELWGGSVAKGGKAVQAGFSASWGGNPWVLAREAKQEGRCMG